MEQSLLDCWVSNSCLSDFSCIVRSCQGNQLIAVNSCYFLQLICCEKATAWVQRIWKRISAFSPVSFTIQVFFLEDEIQLISRSSSSLFEGNDHSSEISHKTWRPCPSFRWHLLQWAHSVRRRLFAWCFVRLFKHPLLRDSYSSSGVLPQASLLRLYKMFGPYWLRFIWLLMINYEDLENYFLQHPFHLQYSWIYLFYLRRKYSCPISSYSNCTAI